MKQLLKIITAMIVVALANSACKKSDYLSEKPDQKIVIPTTLKDCEAMLDNIGTLNGYGIGLVPGLAQAGSDDSYVVPYFFTSGYLNDQYYINSYIWSDSIYSNNGHFPQDWGFGYRCVFYANTALELLAKITPTADEQAIFNRLKASALFYRAHAFWWLLQAYALPYDEATSQTDLGIPLKMTADINEKLSRASVKECYEKVIADLNESLTDLPSIPPFITRPSRLSVYGLLARIYLSKREYDKALINAEAYLAIKSTLLDYNSIVSSRAYPMPEPRTGPGNPEIAFYSNIVIPAMDVIATYTSRIDSNLYSSYATDDLRKSLFFKAAGPYYGIPGDNGYFFTGSYLAGDHHFAGIATDELYLTRAECYARMNNIADAMNDLNTLLKKRWSNAVQYTDVSATTSAEALAKVLQERRKELVYRGLRWVDIRRLNKEGANITVSRMLNGQTYTLAPNSLKYAWVLPNDVLSFNPGMQQNPR